MSNTILIIGESGSGKSTSTRNLNPRETFYVNVIGKQLPFKGGKDKYIKGKDWNDKTGNYYVTDDWIKIIKCIDIVNKAMPHIKTLIIDDFQYVLANEFMRRVSEVGYSKFSEMGSHYWQIINEASAARNDLTCVLMSHSHTDETGKVKCKTIGKMLEEKITVEGMFTNILHSLHTDEGYKFLTQSDTRHMAKTPMGMFDELTIDNDLVYVLEKVNEYYK